MPRTVIIWLVGASFCVGPGAVTTSARAEDRQAFAVPQDRSAWEAQRNSIREVVWKALGGRPLKPKPAAMRTVSQETREGVRVERIQIEAGPSGLIAGGLVLPGKAGPGQRSPVIVLLSGGTGQGLDDPLQPGTGGQPPALTLAQRGFAVFWTDPPFAAPRRVQDPASPLPGIFEKSAAGRTVWGRTLQNDVIGLDALIGRPDIDAKRIGVAAFGLGGTRVWWLMALDERLACGIAASGLTRLTDWQSAQGPSTQQFAPWVVRLLGHFDTEAILALCAPRQLGILVGDRDPSSPETGIGMLEATAKQVYALYGQGDGFHVTHFGELGQEFTLLEWDMMLEFFDKAFLPQGPAPLGHAPEPEPAFDASFTHLAKQGIEGWASEMSARPGTWTWRDGIIVCNPGPYEYGWLRAPIEADDFILSVEWKIPKGVNTGVFLRAQKVPWFITPSAQGKRRVATLALDWPSRTGLEVQATDDSGSATKYSSGSLYRHAAPSENPVKPAGEWNRYTVRCRGLRVELWCNGRQILDTTLDKYPTLRHPPLKGYFGFQNHAGHAEFRNIFYRRLTPSSAAATAP